MFAFLTHGFLFTNEFFSHDSVNNWAYGINGATPNFYLSVGRFFIPVYETYKGAVVAPWLIGILFTLWTTLAGMFMTSMLGIDSRGGIVFTCGLLCCNITFALVGATYIYCLDEYALALLCATVAAFLFTRGGRFAIVGLFPLYISLGIYQAYATVTLTLCLFDMLRRTRNESRFFPLFRQGVFYLGLLVAGDLLYRVRWDALLSASGVSRLRDAPALQAFPPIERLKLANSMFFDFLLRPNGILAQWIFRIHVVLLLFLLWRLYKTLADKHLVGLWYSHAATYNIGVYLREYLQYPLLITVVPSSELVQSMPIFPAPDSVRMIDGVVVVKLSG